MKKLTSLVVATALCGASLAGPVPKERLNQKEIVQLAQTQQKSQQVLQVQAGTWTDDYGAVVVVGILAVAALTVGIIAIAD
jgi:hypothetical protein